MVFFGTDLYCCSEVGAAPVAIQTAGALVSILERNASDVVGNLSKRPNASNGETVLVEFKHTLI